MPLVAKRYLVRKKNIDEVSSEEKIRASIEEKDTIALSALLDEKDDEDKQTVEKVKKKSGRRKFTDAEAIAWVEDQIHEIRLQEEEDAIQAEYAELQKHMQQLEAQHKEALADPDQEERQIQMMMSTVAKEHDTDLSTHGVLNKNKLEHVSRKSRRSSP